MYAERFEYHLLKQHGGVETGAAFLEGVMIIKSVEKKGADITVTFDSGVDGIRDIVVTCSIAHVWVIKTKDPDKVFVRAYELKPGLDINMPLA